MSSIRFKRYSKPAFLKGIGRELLGKFLGRFTGELAAANIGLPDGSLDDAEYFKRLADVMMSPEGLPAELNEVLYALEEMSSAEAEERLRKAVSDAGLDLQFNEDSAAGEIPLQVWIACPELLVKKHNEQKVLWLASFEHFPSKVAPADRLRFTTPGPEQLERLCNELEEWFGKNNRGKGSSRIDVYQINGKWWFVVRHGDRFQRMPVVQKDKTDILNFRPEKDDVIVFDEALDELSVHAETKGEKKLYCEKFGFYLRQDDRYFKPVKTYTLEPLRTDEEDALDVSDISRLRKIVLREIEVAWPGTFHPVSIRRSDDIFAEARSREKDPIPASGRLMRASFDVYFEGCAKPRKVQVRAGNILKLGRHCDADLVNEWLTRRGFRVGHGLKGTNRTDWTNFDTSLLTSLPGAERGNAANAESLANNCERAGAGGGAG